MAAMILADDPIFGRFCYGGTWQQSGNTNQVVPLDGVRRQFHAMLDAGNLHLVLDNDHFAASQALAVKDDLSRVSFVVETANTASHGTALRFAVSIAGTYTVSDGGGVVATATLAAGEEATFSLPLAAGGASQTFVIAR